VIPDREGESNRDEGPLETRRSGRWREKNVCRLSVVGLSEGCVGGGAGRMDDKSDADGDDCDRELEGT
jgi:hypothetical protein